MDSKVTPAYVPSFDLVIKVSERCNLACDYCYYYFKEYDANQNAAFMSPCVRA